MKAKIFDKDGGEIREIELPRCFSAKIREDISQKYYEAKKKWQPYAPYFMAGKQYSATGKIKHGRRLWKTAYGHGISRVPRKIFWRRGTQFYWQAAEIASTRGGRRAHPPKIAHFEKKLKINKKEKLIALNSALSSTASLEYLKRRYARIEKEIKNLPFIIDSNLLKLKTKDFFIAIKKILNELYELAGKDKKKAGLLLVLGNKENYKTKLFDVRKVSGLEISDLYPLGRLVIYTENAINDLDKLRQEKDLGDFGK